MHVLFVLLAHISGKRSGRYETKVFQGKGENSTCDPETWNKKVWKVVTQWWWRFLVFYFVEKEQLYTVGQDSNMPEKPLRFVIGKNT